MCFEFEALYWAKLAEEEEMRRRNQVLKDAALKEQQRQDVATATQEAFKDETVPA